MNYGEEQWGAEIKPKLEKLLRKWQRQLRACEQEAHRERNLPDRDLYAANRYEGEAIAYRWCIEDLRKALSER